MRKKPAHSPMDAGAGRPGKSRKAARRCETPSARPSVNQGESPLLRLATRRDARGATYLSEVQFAAGERLRADFERARIVPAISANWDRPVGAGGRLQPATADFSDHAIDACRRFEKALACLAADLCGVAIDICCFLKGTEIVEFERGWPPRSAKLMLRAALSVLAAHYGFENAGGVRAMQQWGAADYRPTLAPAG